MMEQAYFIGVDVGTSSTKAIVFSHQAEIKGLAQRQYEMQIPQPGWAEQDPEVIFAAVITTVRSAIEQSQVSQSEIAAVGFSAVMHSLMAVDAAGSPLTPLMLWTDNRSIVQTESLRSFAADLYQRTGVPLHSMSPLTKLVWMREKEPDLFQRVARFISIKEYIVYNLLGCYQVDFAIAATSGLLNLQRLQWDETALAIAGIRSAQLSPVVPTTHILRGLKRDYAEAMGLAGTTPIVIGANDGVLANLGMGAITPGQVAVTIGTSGAVRTAVSAPTLDPQGRTFCYPLTEQRWMIGGATNNGGMILHWFRDQLGDLKTVRTEELQGDAYADLLQMAATVPAGAEGLLFLPYLAGERAPHWNVHARGVFFGIALHHQRSHFVRSLLEGILFNLSTIHTILQELAGSTRELIASGGFARSTLWCQMMADLFGYEVLIPEVYEGSALGAAVLAMYAVGALPALTEVQNLVRIKTRYQPNQELTKTYRSLAAIYDRLYKRLEPEFINLAGYDRPRPHQLK